MRPLVLTMVLATLLAWAAGANGPASAQSADSRLCGVTRAIVTG